MLAVAKIERPVFVCTRKYELLPVQRVLFLLAVTLTSNKRFAVFLFVVVNLRCFVSFVSGREN